MQALDNEQLRMENLRLREENEELIKTQDHANISGKLDLTPGDRNPVNPELIIPIACVLNWKAI